MDRSDVERLVRLEAGQQSLEERIDDVAIDVRDHRLELREHRSESADKLEELRKMLLALGQQVESRHIRWSDIATKDNVKAGLAVLLAILAGAGGAASAVKALFDH